MARLPIVKPGKRVTAAGFTGSGKSTWACWMLMRSPGKWVILNPKHTAAYQSLPDSTVINTLDFATLEKAMQDKEIRFFIVNPQSDEASPDNLDDFVMLLHQRWSNIGLCCDELYALHKGAHAGQGLIGWLTRGRELKQSFIGLTQRPAWLSQFLFSEADYLVAMRLRLRKDRRKIYEMTDEEIFLSIVPKHHWVWYDQESSEYTHYGPVPV